MSIKSKKFLLQEIETELKDKFSPETNLAIQTFINQALTKYEVEILPDLDTEKTNEYMLQAFIDAKELEGRSDKTIERYKYLLGKMLKEINTPIPQITIIHLRNYLRQKRIDGIADKTLEGTRSVLCTFFSWLEKEGLIDSNPCNNLSPIKCNKKVRFPYSETDIEKLKEACFNNRDKALICFMLSTGCRISEICALNKNDVNFETRECIVFGKGGKERTVFFDELTAMYLQRYFMSRRDNCPALFASKLRERITPRGARALLADIGKRAGVENVHPHRFRRTLATNLIAHGMPIQEVANILGHDKLDTTMTYVYLDKTNVKSSYQKYS